MRRGTLLSKCATLCKSSAYNRPVLLRSRTSTVIHRNTDVLNGRLVWSTVAGTDAAVERLRSDPVVSLMQTADFRNSDDTTG
jgi:hypothetical protein